MQIKVLGSAAGGGFPQWNCNCRNCSGVRQQTIPARARTQSSIAVSANGADWVLVNASPDLLAQIKANPELQPARQARDSGIAAVLLMDAQIDHVTGLLMLRERGTPLPLYATDPVWADLSAGFPIGPILSHYCTVARTPIPLDATPFEIPPLAGIRFTAIPLSSKAPPYSPHRNAPETGDNIGLMIEETATGTKVFYAPGLGEMSPEVLDAMRRAQLVLVDGTFWTATEMIDAGFSSKRAADMGHLPQSGAGGMIEILSSIGDAPRKVLIHINNTNPILDESSPERATLGQHQIDVAHDGMTFNL